MFQLDVRSIVFSNFVYTTVLALFLLFFGIKEARRIPGLNWWTYGFLLFALNFLLISFREFLPVFVSDVIPHAVTILGLYLIKQGLARFFNSKSRIWFDIIAFLLGFAVLAFLSGGNLRPRLFVISGSAILAYVLTLYMLKGIDGARPVRIFLGVAVVLQVCRLFLGYFCPKDIAPVDGGWKLSLISMFLFLSLMMIALSLVAVTIRKLLLEWDEIEDRVKHDSVTDTLTGLMNRYGFSAVFDVEEKRSIRKKTLLSLIVADIDDFKLINDKYGMTCGDDVLKYIADVFRREFRGGDILARWGGEEFLVVQPETDLEACRTSLERTRQAIAREPFKRNGDIFYVTMSFGFHTAVAGALGLEDLIKEADKNLYKAKKGGKNKVIGESST